ncbi:exo-rhamnogalacturonan lyase family protein [Kineococcus arenarius]|uniref:exo-rhamnogalacturonan lyase family protein n=1 Tax=unclassified Kineococcus TaxID=2621656 RepID=UPI003D7DA9D2
MSLDEVTTTDPAAAADDETRGGAVHEVPLRWIDEDAPGGLPGGATLGVPLPRGLVSGTEGLRVVDAAGAGVPAQFWPLATWPDGTTKWSGVALPATATPSPAYRVLVAPGAPDPLRDAGAPVVRVSEEGERVLVDAGGLLLRVARRGPALFESLELDGTVVARGARLVSELAADPAGHERTAFDGAVEEVAVEQRGPVRAVLRLRGHHRGTDPAGAERTWLPFTVRLVVHAGARSVGVVHSFVFDGDGERDFLAALGVRMDVPLRAEPHDRHVRFASAEGGVFREAVRGVTGLRRDPGEPVRTAQLEGRATPPVRTWADPVPALLHHVPAWSQYRLRQRTADGFDIAKRLGPDRGWVGAAAGTRAAGYVCLGDPAGALAVAVADFWQSHPAGLDVTGAAGRAGEDEATLTAWLWSPDAAPMDLRAYNDGASTPDHASQLEALEITYEDFEEGFADAHGTGRTSELTFTAHPGTPPTQRVADDARAAGAPPQLAPTPAALHAAGVFGDWAPVDRSTPARAALEDRLEFLLDFYRDQVEQRRWYGFWNHGDVMHAYDADRHVWRYDVGGYAWDNSELSPDLWLWTSFLRTGRADVFRLARAMTRHTGDVDVYHLGRWAGLGSRHNVQHFGCSAKQLRISNPAYRRFLHYLTADEHTGDLMAELVDSDTTFLALDPTRKVREDAATYAPRREALAVGLGTDWGSLAATWLADWERTGSPRSRDRLLGTMADIADLPQGFLTGEALYDLDRGRFDTSRDRIAVSHLSAVFGLVEVASELVDLTAGTEVGAAFEAAWLRYCRLFNAPPEEQAAEVGAPLSGTHLEQAHSRLTAYAAARTGDERLARRAWEEFERGGEFLRAEAFTRRRLEPPEVLAPVDEARTLSTNDAAQFSLAAIQNLALAGHALP